MFGVISAAVLLLGAITTLFVPYVGLLSKVPDVDLWEEGLFSIFEAAKVFPNSIDYSQGGMQAMTYSSIALILTLPIIVLAIIKLIRSIKGMVSSKDPNKFQQRKEKMKGIAPNPSLYIYCLVILVTATLIFTLSHNVRLSVLLWSVSVMVPFVAYIVLYCLQKKVLKETSSK